MILKITCYKCNQEYTINCNNYGCNAIIHYYFDKGKMSNKNFLNIENIFNENNFLKCYNCHTKTNFSIELIIL